MRREAADPQSESAAFARRLGRFFDRSGVLVRHPFGARDERRLQVLLDRLLRDHALGDVAARRELEHHVEQCGLDDRAQTARTGLALERLVGDLPERVVRKHELDAVVAEETLVLLHERVLRLHQDLHEVFALQLVHGRDDREPADELRDEPEVQQVFRHHFCEQLGRLDGALRAHVRDRKSTRLNSSHVRSSYAVFCLKKKKKKEKKGKKKKKKKSKKQQHKKK